MSNEKRFCVTYEINTPVSAADNLPEESGPIGEFDHLHDAIDHWRATRTEKADFVASIRVTRDLHGLRLHIVNGPEFDTGAYEERTLLIRKISKPSAQRLASTLGIDLPDGLWPNGT